MPRVKRGTHHTKRRHNILKRAKGFKWGRKSKLKLAKTAVTKAGMHAYRDRRVKKRTARALWSIKINAAARLHNTTYSRLISALKKQNILLDRKILSQLAERYPEVLAQLLKQTTK